VTDKPDNHVETDAELDRGAQAEGEPNGAGESAAEAGAEAANEVRDLQEALDEVQQELAASRDAMLRMQADMENLRKRLIRDLERSRKFALESIMRDLLPVCDSLERGLETEDGTATIESLKQGKALIKRMLDKVMEDHGLAVLDPLGEPFDPELHEAMTMRHSDEFGENTVAEVMQKGFLLHDRLIRPAMVVVSQGPESD
jgi:molecular chaperone GrpE